LTNRKAERATGLPSAVVASTDEKYVNPQGVSLLNLLDMNVECERRAGSELSRGTVSDAARHTVKI
jgi:hypothetical protein